MSLNRLFLRTVTVSRACRSLRRFLYCARSLTHIGFTVAVTRSAFTSSKRDTANPNWFRVGLAFGTSAVLWGMLITQHSVDVADYKASQGIE